MRQVAVTGVGLLCAAGLDPVSARARLAQGPLAPQPPPDAGVSRPWLLPLAEGFDARKIVSRRKDLKLMARANRLALGAARQAVAQAGLTADPDAGLFLAVGREPMSLAELLPVLHQSSVAGQVTLDRLIDEGMHWMHPLASLKTLPNMCVAHVAIELGLQGPTMALCDDADMGPLALAEAALAIARGDAPWALAGGADARLAFGDRLSADTLGDGDRPLSEAAAVFALEPLDAARARGATVLAVLGPAEGASPVRSDRLGDCGAATLAAALALDVGQRAVAAGSVGLWPAPAAPALHLAPAPAQPLAISACGLVTPLGDDLPTLGARLLRGESAAGPIQAFDARRFPVRNACEVPDRDLLARLPSALAESIRGHDDRRAELALAAGLDAAARHGALPRDAAVVFAAGLTSVTIGQVNQGLAPFVQDGRTFDYAGFAARTRPAREMTPWRNLVTRPLHLLADHLGLQGPRAAHFSACAAGSAAVAHAAALIRRGEAPAALVGGADSMVHPFGMLPFVRLGATSAQEDPALCGRPFDAERDGFIMGEGGAFFVLEPLEAARAAGRAVLGVYLGAGTSMDAWRVTAPHPEGLGAERAMRGALADAGLPPEVVDYVNAHGTGTPLNDVAEAQAVARVFGQRPALSSSKGQLGHAIAAAGAVELAVLLAAFAGDGLPPNAHLSTPDPALDADLVEPGGRAGAPGVALSNSFGFGGQNASLLIAHPDHEAAR